VAVLAAWGPTGGTAFDLARAARMDQQRVHNLLSYRVRQGLVVRDGDAPSPSGVGFARVSRYRLP